MQTFEHQLLASSPKLPDGNFAKAVVLIIHHNEEGAFGLVLNHRSGNTIEQVWKKVAQTPCENQDYLYVGGPVEGPLMAIHTSPLFGEQEFMPGIYISTERESLEQLVQQQGQPLRLFSGYAGWGGGQLESEMEAGAWISVAANPEYIFGSEDLWQKVTRDIVKKTVFDSLNIKHIPDDPLCN